MCKNNENDNQVQIDTDNEAFEEMLYKNGDHNALPVLVHFNDVSRVGCSYRPLIDESEELLCYLDEKYPTDTYKNGGISMFYCAENSTVDQVREEILSANLPGIYEHTISKHVSFQQIKEHVFIILVLY